MNLAADPKADAFEALAAQPLTATTKGIPPLAAPIALGAVGKQGWNLLRGDLPFPLAMLSRAALEHNSRWMRAFIQANKLSIAPHGKTTMAPSSSVARSRTGPGPSPWLRCSSSWSAGASASTAC